MKQTVKYCRTEGNTLIVVPTAEGHAVLAGKGLDEGTDTIAGKDVKALVKKFAFTIKNFEHKEAFSRNQGSIFVYTDGETFNIGYPCFVKEKESSDTK